MRTSNSGEGVRDGRCSSRQQSARNKAARKRPAPDWAEYYNRIVEEDKKERLRGVAQRRVVACSTGALSSLFVCLHINCNVPPVAVASIF